MNTKRKNVEVLNVHAIEWFDGSDRHHFVSIPMESTDFTSILAVVVVVVEFNIRNFRSIILLSKNSLFWRSRRRIIENKYEFFFEYCATYRMGDE